jgi:hypothetical protein
MESRSGRLRGSNKKTEGNLCFFLPDVFASVIRFSSIRVLRRLGADYPGAIVIEAIATEKTPVACTR